MKIQVAVVLLFVGCTCAISIFNPLYYVLKNKDLVRKEISCVLDKGPCDNNGQRIKDLAPDAINNHCRKCASWERTVADDLIEHMQENYREEWDLIVKKYTKH